MPKTIRVSPTFTEADKADREFYKKLSGNERLDILLEIIRHEPEQRLERIFELLNSQTRTRRARPSL